MNIQSGQQIAGQQTKARTSLRNTHDRPQTNAVTISRCQAVAADDRFSPSIQAAVV